MQDEWRSDSPLGQLWPSSMLSRVPTCSPRLVRSLQRCPWGYVARPIQSGARSSGGPQRAKGAGASPRTALVMRAICMGLSSQHGLGCSGTTTAKVGCDDPLVRMRISESDWLADLDQAYSDGVDSDPNELIQQVWLCTLHLLVPELLSLCSS